MYETGELAQVLGVGQPELATAPAPEGEPVQAAPLGIENRLG